MEIVNKFNKDYLSWVHSDNRSPVTHLMLFAKCLDNSSSIKTFNGDIKLSDIPLNKEFELISYNSKNSKFEIDSALRVDSGEKEVFELETYDGRKILASKDHKFFVRVGGCGGYITERKLADLKEGDEIIVFEEKFCPYCHKLILRKKVEYCNKFKEIIENVC